MSKRSPDAIDRMVGHNIHIQRMAKGLSQDELGEQVGISFQQVQKYETGTNRISVGRLVRISRVLDVPLLTLFEGIEGGSAPVVSPQALLADQERLALVQAFARLEDKAVRKSLVAFVRQISQGRRRVRPAETAT